MVLQRTQEQPHNFPPCAPQCGMAVRSPGIFRKGPFQPFGALARVFTCDKILETPTSSSVAQSYTIPRAWPLSLSLSRLCPKASTTNGRVKFVSIVTYNWRTVPNSDRIIVVYRSFIFSRVTEEEGVKWSEMRLRVPRKNLIRRQHC